MEAARSEASTPGRFSATEDPRLLKSTASGPCSAFLWVKMSSRSRFRRKANGVSLFERRFVGA
jgi:hypothetical protein